MLDVVRVPVYNCLPGEERRPEAGYVQQLNQIDYLVIGLYFAILIGLGIYLKRLASTSLEGYFLGNRQLPWWTLGISGMASFVDVTGTMLVVSFLFMLGPRGLYIEFRGGAVLVLAVYLLWAGKWHRRSGCMTGAEWMVFRFGEGPGGQFARVARALTEVVFVAGMLIYMAKGVGLFLSMFIPLAPSTCSLILIGVATLYTMMSGFYGVVFTDMFQSVIILIAVIVISTLAFLKVPDSDSLATLAAEITGGSQWTSSAMSLHTPMPKGYEVYESLAMFAMFYLFRNIFFGMGGGDDPKYFGARNDRECGTLTFLWTWLMTARWPMMMGFAVLGIFLVHDLFPDQTVLGETTALVKAHVGAVEPPGWADRIAGVIHHPEAYPAELRAGLARLLGNDWREKLPLVSFHGTVDPERILPAVILFDIPKGLRGLLLVALIAASMSTFDSTVNRGTGFVIRDLYQRYLRPRAPTGELIYAAWAFIITSALAGWYLGNFVQNVNAIWDWLAMSFGGGLLVPLFLRLYWWRFNGGGFAIGSLLGLVGAIGLELSFPALDPRWKFLSLLGVGFGFCLLGTYLTPPTDPDVLGRFYRTTRPFGFWGPLKRALPDRVRRQMVVEHRNDLLALPFTLGWQTTLFLLPMQLVIHAYGSFLVTLLIFGVCLGGMYVFWYRQLPPAEFALVSTAEQPLTWSDNRS